jgi:hypothetical protein
MKKSNTVGNLMVALAKSQAEFPEFKKEKAEYNYNYLTLDNILTKVLPILGKNGIAVVQEHRMNVVDGVPFVLINTELFCGDEWIAHTVMFPLGEPNKGSTEIMQCGSVASYLRRYSLVAMLGIAGGDKDIEEINDELNGKVKLIG